MTLECLLLGILHVGTCKLYADLSESNCAITIHGDQPAFLLLKLR